ncbi:MAG: hypothetical protein ACP5NS_00680 [Candidatus Pacearchaeota archaeon]
MQNRGLSAVMGTVMMTLLVIIAVSTMWAFVRPALSKSATSAGNSADCFTLDVKTVSCMQHAPDINGFRDLDIKINRRSGKGDLTGLKFVFIKTNEETIVGEDLTNIPDELETVTSNVNGLITEQIDSVLVAAMLGPNKFVCTPNTAPTLCSQVP